MGLRSKNKVDPNFNMSSMTDIVFLLLIFFIVLSTFVSVHGLDIDLPKTKAAVNPIHTQIVVEIDKNYTYMINGKITSLEGVISELESQAAGMESPSLILVADAKVEWQKGMEVIAEAKNLGYTKIVVRTEANQ
ncbi:MAG: hypothetical protein RLZZ414_775 [Bacteroidota bacterium]|jgi:biopolymer transport protein ExbD